MKAMLIGELIPEPGLHEVDHVDLGAPTERVWPLVRHGDLGRAPLIRALFAVRTLPSRSKAERGPVLCIDSLVSSPSKPGFRVLGEREGRFVAVGAVGKVWRPDIPFVHVEDAEAFERFAEPDHVKVAWELRIEPLGPEACRLTIEVRVSATDARAWRRFRRYFRFIGPGSRWIRASALAQLERRFGTPTVRGGRREMPGDELLRDAAGEENDGVEIDAPPGAVWPWLIQMGCGRAGFYAYDALDNGWARSARELHPELQRLAIGDVIPATPEGADGFEVLRIEPERTLVLGGLFDPAGGRQLPFAGARPERFWHVTWAFQLEPIGDSGTRLSVRARAAFSRDQRLHAAWMAAAHRVMQGAQLRHLAALVEGRAPRDDWRDVVEGAGGAGRMLLALATPWARRRRACWGVDPAAAASPHPGDDVVPDPRWGWTHGVEIDAPPTEVWPWLEQLGAGRGGFYSYQWLENVFGCEVQNAEAIHPEWRLAPGGRLALHPKMPPLIVGSLVPGSHFVAQSPPVDRDGGPWVMASWLFLLEPLPRGRSRLVSRYRVATSDDLPTRLAFGSALLEPVGFAMDRRMLLGIKERAERLNRPLAAPGPVVRAQS
jgi:hypothetical protein